MANTKSAMSDPSLSIDEINIPEVSDLSAEFVYNYYVSDERIKPIPQNDKALTKIPRYVILKWSPPTLSRFEKEDQNAIEATDTTNLYSISENAKKLISEDNSLNLRYYSHTFSNISSIEQGASDLETYSRLSGSPAESMFKMAEEQLINTKSVTPDDSQKNSKINGLLDSYAKLSNFPKDSLGLRVIKNGKEIKDQDDFLDSIVKSISTTIKLHGSIIPDAFESSIEKSTGTNVQNFNSAYANVVNIRGNSPDIISIDPIKIDESTTAFKYLKQPVRITGYVIDRYRLTETGFEKEATIYIEDPTISTYVDRSVLYGETYFYAIRVVANVQMLLYSSPDSRENVTQVSTLYVMSKNISTPVECFEYVPPPPPEDVRFSFDYEKMNLTIHWDVPANPQKDVKQFQVFRRKSIKEPFELIAQYGFDMSDPGANGQKYVTGEVIDANNLKNMIEENKVFVKNFRYPIYSHTDEDFTVDTEFFISSEYIYAICSIDAHGLISNYSEQIQVRFDSNKNRLVIKSICDAGSPKQYPNMNLKIDTFKDVIHVEGKELKKLQVYFTPEYLRVKDSIFPSQQYKIVEAKTSNPNSKNSCYLLQLINLDNQKLQTLKINVLDTQGVTI